MSGERREALYREREQTGCGEGAVLAIRDSGREWKNPYDPDARIAKMKDGSTHLAHKAEHAVDWSSGALLAVTLQGADQGDTTTIHQTLAEAGEAVAERIEHEAVTAPTEEPKVNLGGIQEAVADKGYHSGSVLQHGAPVRNRRNETCASERKGQHSEAAAGAGRGLQLGADPTEAGGDRQTPAVAGGFRMHFRVGASYYAMLVANSTGCVPARAGWWPKWRHADAMTRTISSRSNGCARTS
jgi:hypothetical protein